MTVTDQQMCKKQLRLEISGDVVRAETDKVAAELARQVNVPGFRRGHVPKSVVKARFKKELRDQVLSHLIPHSLGDAIKEKELKVVGQPSVDELKFRDDETIDLTVTVEVAPEFELSNYKGLPVRKPEYRVRDEDVARAIDRLRNQHAELVPVEDRGARTGDIVSATITQRPADGVEGEETKGAKPKGQDIDIELGAKGVLKEFNEAFDGARAGETRQFGVDYAEDYKPQEFAGRHVDYTAEVTAVRARELPEADDEFAKSVSEDFETIDQLRGDIRGRLEHDATHRSDESVRTAVMDQLVDRNRFDVPEVAVESQMDARVRSLVRQLAAQGMDPRALNLDWKQLREANRERAIRETRSAFVLDRIAEVEKIEVSEAELNAEIEMLAQASRQSVEATKARLTKDGSVDSLKEQVRNRKALDLVIASAEIRVEPIEGVADEGHDE